MYEGVIILLWLQWEKEECSLNLTTFSFVQYQKYYIYSVSYGIFAE